MKITIYELLGLVKDGKVPKKIKWNDLIYEKSKYNATPRGFYYRINGEIKLWLLDEINSLNDEVEILEEEKKIPEKIEQEEIEISMAIGEQICANKINEIIDYLNRKGDE